MNKRKIYIILFVAIVAALVVIVAYGQSQKETEGAIETGTRNKGGEAKPISQPTKKEPAKVESPAQAEIIKSPAPVLEVVATPQPEKKATPKKRKPKPKATAVVAVSPSKQMAEMPNTASIQPRPRMADNPKTMSPEDYAPHRRHHLYRSGTVLNLNSFKG